MLLFRVLFVVLQFAVRFTTSLLDFTAKIYKFQLPLKHNLTKLRADSKSLKRLPIHVGIVIVEDEISFADLANLLLWCMAMGISYISIYDVAGKKYRLLPCQARLSWLGLGLSLTVTLVTGTH